LLGVYPNTARAVVLIVYTGTVVSGVPSGGAEALDARLFSPEALPQLAFEHDYQILNDFFGDRNEGSGLNRVQQIARLSTRNEEKNAYNFRAVSKNLCKR